MPDRKLKIDLLKKREISPHLINLKKEETKKIKFTPTVYLFKKICLVFFVAIFVVSIGFLIKLSLFQIIELKTKLVEAQLSNLDNFFNGFENLKNFNFEKAGQKFNLAKNDFSQSLEKIEGTNFLTKIFFRIHPRSKLTINLLKIFKDSSEIGEVLAKTGQEIQALIHLPDLTEEKEEIKTVLPQEIFTLDFLTIVKTVKEKTVIISKLTKRIEKNLFQIKISSIPPNFQKFFDLIKAETPPLNKTTQDLIVFLENFEKIIAENSFKRYLILFQNNNEIRATGGFLGTYALIDFERGKIKNFEMPAGGTYDLAGWLTVKVAPPSPFFIAQPKWFFHDANWFPHFPTSAEKLIWFLERSGGPTVDGVIVFNAELISDFLEVIGEISLSDYQKIINSKNFILETQKAIEIERREKGKPKQFLVDLTPILLRKIFSLEPAKLASLSEKIISGFEEKKITLYFNDKTIEKFFQEKNWAGEIKESPFDYLQVVVTNVNGAKTEGVISQKIHYQIEVDIDGSMLTTLTIRRNHQGQKDDFFTGRKDLSWLRVYLPKGTVFLGSQGATKKELAKIKEGMTFDEDLKKIEKEINIDQFSGTRITEEFNKTCFGNFLEISPGEEKEISFKYLLPFKLDLNKKPTPYSLLIQKQPGRKSEVEVEIILPEKRKIIWQHPEKIRQEDKIIKWEADLETDKFFAFIVE